jgi:polyisoprenoid-binding protein YceI
VDGAWEVEAGDGTDQTTFAGYRVTEELANIGATEAVGRTGDIAGTLVLEGTTVVEVEVEVDLSTLESDKSGRDAQLRRQALETNTFPTATFTLTTPIELDAVPAEGAPIDVVAQGDLTLHGVTNAVELPLEAQLVGDRIAVVGSLQVAFADYAISAPQAVAVLSVEDVATMEFQLFYARTESVRE